MKLMDPVSLEIMWGRLVAIADEAAATLVRTAFSTIVYESNDYACILLDTSGDAIVHSKISAPSFIGCLPVTTKNMLEAYPLDTLKPGDVIATNDPWLAAGHLPDINVVTPIFRKGRIVAFSGCISHVVDIGGIPISTMASEVYEEGLWIPPLKLYDAGKPNETLFKLIRRNVRAPEQVLGDIEALVTANAMAARRLEELLEEEGMEDLQQAAQAIMQVSEDAMRAGISSVPDGDYYSEVLADGFEELLVVKAKVSIRGSEIHIDFDGTSPQVPRGINACPNYTYAYTAFGVKSLLDPDTPNNQGAFRPIKVTAPEGCFLNPRQPAPCGSRNLTGHILPFAVFRALADVLPDRVAADAGAAPGWSLICHGSWDDGTRFAMMTLYDGGIGATSYSDGVSCVAWPGHISNVPAELMEYLAPIWVKERRLAPDSAGAGRFRGGLGQRFAIQSMASAPMRVSLQTEKVRTVARGLKGGRDGAPGSVLINGVPAQDTKGLVNICQGDTIQLALPGGGGFGDPLERDRARVVRDVFLGYVSPEEAQAQYGVTVSQEELAALDILKT